MWRSLALAALAFVLVGADCDPYGPPRIASCRAPRTDFTGVEEVRIIRAFRDLGVVSVELEATGTGHTDCTLVTGTLFQGGVEIDSLTAPVRTVVSRGTATTSPLYLLGGGFDQRVVVTAFGRTLESPVTFAGAPDVPLDVAR